MHITTSTHAPDHGWSTPLHELDAPEQSSAHVVFVFGASSYARMPEPIAQIHERFPDALLVGCSTAGEILQGEIFDDHLCMTSVHFEKTRAERVTIGFEEGDDSIELGKRLGTRLSETQTPRIIYLFSDGLHVNGDRLARGIHEVVSTEVLVAGGLAGDGPDFQATWVLQDNTPHSHTITALALYGDALELCHSSRGGWDTFGPMRQVTASRDNVLMELDGQPALELYKRYLGDLSDALPGSALRFPLAIDCDDAQTPHLVRTVLSVDDQDQSMTFAGDIPQGSNVWLMTANHERLINGAEIATQTLVDCVEQGQAQPHLVIAVSCVGRKLVLGHRTEEELEMLWEALPEGSALTGFYSYGELAPATDAQGPCVLHNQTLTLTMLRER